MFLTINQLRKLIRESTAGNPFEGVSDDDIITLRLWQNQGNQSTKHQFEGWLDDVFSRHPQLVSASQAFIRNEPMLYRSVDSQAIQDGQYHVDSFESFTTNRAYAQQFAETRDSIIIELPLSQYREHVWFAFEMMNANVPFDDPITEWEVLVKGPITIDV